MASNLKGKRSASPQSKNSAHVPMPPGFTANCVSGTPGIHGTAPNEPPILMYTLGTRYFGALPIIRWDASGERIVLAHPKRIEEHVLSSVFRQTRLASFYRQLNIYGFSHKSNVDPAIEDHDATVWGRPHVLPSWHLGADSSRDINRSSPLELVVGAKRHVTPRKPRKSPHATPPESGTENQDRGTPNSQSRSWQLRTAGRPNWAWSGAQRRRRWHYQTCARCGTRSPSWLKGGNGVFCSVCGQYDVVGLFVYRFLGPVHDAMVLLAEFSRAIHCSILSLICFLC
ncbi:hypothetical protein GGX14DRAFT_626632 [Mycena pura]|uniref:HSF-type DNA-binding domain-containing protein n=1 Tax=Mycena pura TaxID=153505 RepID=A0AAD6YAI3_9AGAR|nr:hypothetical protein GGX14DRAFT_626632 [Mycena pura]